MNAIRTLGPDRAREVAVTRRDVNNAELQKLHESDIRGLRFYFLVDDFVVDDLATMARKIAPMSWHVQVQDDGDWLLDVLPILKSLPVDSVLDHIGRTPAAGGINDSNFQALLRFLESGKLWVKISAPYLQTLDGPPYYADVGEKVKAMVSVRPDRLVWAANWPHPNLPAEAKPEEADCLDPLLEWVPDDAILADNPAKFYGF